MEKNNLPAILTISSETYVASKGKSLENYELVELDSEEIIAAKQGYEEMINDTFGSGAVSHQRTSKFEAEEALREFARESGIEAIVGYTPSVIPGISRTFFDEGAQEGYHIKATGLKPKN
jgi:high-affinity Fe2+/Pb2+ permease